MKINKKIILNREKTLDNNHILINFISSSSSSRFCILIYPSLVFHLTATSHYTTLCCSPPAASLQPRHLPSWSIVLYAHNLWPQKVLINNRRRVFIFPWINKNYSFSNLIWINDFGPERPTNRHQFDVKWWLRCVQAWHAEFGDEWISICIDDRTVGIRLIAVAALIAVIGKPKGISIRGDQKCETPGYRKLLFNCILSQLLPAQYVQQMIFL